MTKNFNNRSARYVSASERKPGVDAACSRQILPRGYFSRSASFSSLRRDEIVWQGGLVARPLLFVGRQLRRCISLMFRNHMAERRKEIDTICLRISLFANETKIKG
jgi:hypothetical protein